MEEGRFARHRLRLDEKSWRVLLERFDGAALTVAEFCHREGLTLSSFNRWRGRLRSGPKHARVPVVANAAALTEYAALDLRIELGGGLSLHLVRR